MKVERSSKSTKIIGMSPKGRTGLGRIAWRTLGSAAAPSNAPVREAPRARQTPLGSLLHPSASLAATLPSGAAKLAAEEPDRTKASEAYRARGGIIHGL